MGGYGMGTEKGYVFRSGTRSGFRYWYRLAESGNLFRGPSPRKSLVASRPKRKEDPPADGIVESPWANIEDREIPPWQSNPEMLSTPAGILFNRWCETRADLVNAELDLGLHRMAALLVLQKRDTVATVSLLCAFHRRLMGHLFDWAGEFRTIQMGVEGMLFARPNHIAASMEEFERTLLRACTPARRERERLFMEMARLHVELIAIHPFRDGNGRVARALMDLMCLQAGLPPVSAALRDREDYFAAMRAGYAGDYRPLRDLVDACLSSLEKIAQ